MKRSCLIALLSIFANVAFAQNASQERVLEDFSLEDLKPKIHGTIRGRYEMQPDEDGQSRFEVRSARVSVEGNLPLHASYKAELNLSDEGKIKLLDAYARLNPYKKLNITLGQFRVPFTIDAHRGPHKQYFANRSFIAKQVGNVRDVGLMVGYEWNAPFKVVFDAAVFNGSGIGEPQKEAWHNDFNYSARLQTFPLKNVNFTASVQRSRCNGLDWAHYTSMDFGAYYENRHLHLEGEFLRKFYENGISEDVNAYNMMAIYRHKLKNCYFQDISYLLRYDYMGDYADGKSIPMVTEDGVSVWNGEKVLLQNQHQRHRVTAGVTFHLKYKTFNTDLRLNYENYFYRDNAVPKIAEQDKIVAELMVRF